ncbi:MAG: MoaD/ThiS family protein [Cyclobacteriaceae bacterium]|nr:MoaD/ThiS family protein [Cyclobacteriaceae bacterium]
MKVRVFAYGIVRDIAGKSFELEVPGKTVGALRQALLNTYPSLGNLPSLLVAVNQEYADDSQPVKPDDEVVLIPPVSGG